MKHLKKIWHVSTAMHKDPFLEINRHLRSFRTTPHPTTGAIPAELLFGRKISSIIPDLRPDPALSRQDIVQARARDKEAKEKMKMYKDRGRYVNCQECGGRVMPGKDIIQGPDVGLS